MYYHKSQPNEKSRELLDSILEGSTEYGIIATDLEDKIVIWNKGAERIYGYSSEEMIGKTTPTNLHENDPINNDILFLVKKTFDSRMLDYQMNAARKDGTTVPVSVTVTPRINKNNKKIGFLIIVRDITKIKLQKKYRDVLIEIAYLVNLRRTTKEVCDSVISAISNFLDIKIIFICINDDSKKSFNIYSQVGLCDNYTCHKCNYSTDLNSISTNNISCHHTYSQLTINSTNLEEHSIKEHIAEKEILESSNYSIINIPLLSDIALLGILHIIVPTSTKNFLLAETQVLSLIANEISAGIQRKKLEEEIRINSDNLEKIVKERTDELRIKDAQLVQSGKLATLGEMATGIAHEINQPLGSISLMTQGLILAQRKNKLESELLEKKLFSIINQIDRINKIITHLRTFARQSSDNKAEVNVNKPLEDVFELIGQQLKNRNIIVSLNLQNNLPQISADHNKLEQVFLNIIGNSRDALDDFEYRIPDLLKIHPEYTWLNSWNKQINIKTYLENGYVVIEISDNAAGIPNNILSKIFEPFFTTKDVGKGTGLGLSITYGIVKEFGGDIEIETKELNGSKFIIKFPSI